MNKTIRVVFVSMGLIILVIIVSILFDNRSNSVSVENSTSGSTNNTSTPPVQTAVTHVAFGTTTISNLVKNLYSYQSSTVTIKGTIEQKGEATYIDPSENVNDTFFLLKVGDGDNSLLVELPKNTLNQYAVGDTISVGAGVGDLGGWTNQECAGVFQNICTQFGLSQQKNIPVLIPIGNVTTIKESTITTSSIPVSHSITTTPQSPTVPASSVPVLSLKTAEIENSGSFSSDFITSGVIWNLIPPSAVEAAYTVYIKDTSDSNYKAYLQTDSQAEYAALAVGDTIQFQGSLRGNMGDTNIGRYIQADSDIRVVLSK